MRGLAELIIALLELLEAEVRALRAGSFRLGLSLALLVAAGMLSLGGVGLILRAVYLYFALVLSPPTATLMTSVVTLLVSGGLLFGAKRLTR